nr:metallophosphoesterase [Aliterella atlantica]
MTSVPQLLSDPFLQLPTENSVRIVWFTEFAGSRHTVSYGKDFNQSAIATTTKLSRTREDQKSVVDIQYKQPTIRNIWRHEAEVTQLNSNIRLPYRVTSVREDGKSVSSGEFTLAAKPAAGKPLKILLTSDHQLKPMTAANLQKVVETVGKVDAVFFAGDLVNIPDRASEWFDDNRGGAFFPCLQGRAKFQLEKNNLKTTYTGGEIIQHAPLYAAIGNHEVMGRYQKTGSLNDEFGDAYPRQAAIAQLLKQKSDRAEHSAGGDRAFVKDYSFNTDTYEEIFTLPQSEKGGKKYYAVTFGDVRLVVLYATNIWRTPSLDKSAKGKYQERQQDINNPNEWGYGQHIFEDISVGSPQYSWLQEELNSPQFQQAKYKVVMLHHPPHSLGDNIVPAYTNPVQIIEPGKSVRYEYPLEQDYIIRDIVPLLEAANAQLVFYGHSHLWNRFISSSGMHFLETSNVGNSYGAALGDKQRDVPEGNDNYAATGDPNGLEAIAPSIAPLLDKNGQKLPYLASNDITAFSILDTATGSVISYRFDTLKPDAEVMKFDEFKLKINTRIN